jgi:L-alanine-DL-glutamate epimerase-like enolase superfamily enzyme
LKITALETTIYRVPPAVLWRDAELTVSELEFIVVRLQTDEGIDGCGLSYTTGFGGSAIRAVIEDACAPGIIGLDVLEYERIWQSLRRRLNRTGSGISTLAIAAVDIGIWDLLAKSKALPLYRALGAARDCVKVYGSGIDLWMDCSELRDHVSVYLDKGYSAVKIKVGRPTLREDLERVGLARELIGPDRTLLLDANQSFGLDEAMRRLRAFEVFQPHWIEEPLVPEDIEGHAYLRSVMGIPIAIGESLYSKSQFLEYLKHQAADIFQPDVARVGGITEWLKIAHLCEAWGRPVASHFLSELSVHLLCGVSNGLMMEDVTGGSFAELGMTAAPLTIINGIAYAPQYPPGHGIHLDIDSMAQYRVKT